MNEDFFLTELKRIKNSPHFPRQGYGKVVKFFYPDLDMDTMYRVYNERSENIDNQKVIDVLQAFQMVERIGRLVSIYQIQQIDRRVQDLLARKEELIEA